MSDYRRCIDESSCQVIDQTTNEIIDDIKNKHQLNQYYKDNCHDNHTVSYKTEQQYINKQYQKSAQPTQLSHPIVKTKSSQQLNQPNARYTVPNANAYQQNRKPAVNTTTVNGRTYERPVQQQQTSPAAQKSGKWFLIFCIAGMISLCAGVIPVFLVCIFNCVLISKKAKVTDEYGVSKQLDRFIPIAVVLAVVAFVLSIAGVNVIMLLTSLLSETGDIP